MRTKFQPFLYFFLTIAAVLLILKILNWLPLFFQQETLRRYASIDEMRIKLSLKQLLVPSYFPQDIMWPPAEILGQTHPYPAVLMVFNRVQKKDAALVISQAASGSFAQRAFDTSFDVKEKAPYQLKGRKALLEVGTCKNEEPCSRLSWTEDTLRVTIFMKSPPFEVIKIAGSMVH